MQPFWLRQEHGELGGPVNSVVPAGNRLVTAVGVTLQCPILFPRRAVSSAPRVHCRARVPGTCVALAGAATGSGSPRPRPQVLLRSWPRSPSWAPLWPLCP
jgi:hypothetical protein